MADENVVDNDELGEEPSKEELDAAPDANAEPEADNTAAEEGTDETVEGDVEPEAEYSNAVAAEAPVASAELGEGEYPDHQVPAPVSDSPTQETTNEPLPDDHVDQVATTTAVTEEESEEAPEPEVPQERVNASTLLIELESGGYPVTLGAIFSKYSDRSFPQSPLLHDLEALGYAKVEPTPRPEGAVVTEGKPVEEDGVWKRVWVARDWNDEEKATQLAAQKEQANQKILQVRNDDFEMGLEFSFQDTSFHAQLRDGDRINLMFLNDQAKERLAAGSDETEPFRSYENISYELPPQELLDLTYAALAAYKAILRNSWAIKDQVDRATTVAELPEIPGTFLPSSSALKLGASEATE
jgi:hypothetical protein